MLFRTQNPLALLISGILLITFIQVNGQVQNFDKVGQEWLTDLNRSSIELKELKALMKRDGIPPIDQPKFIKASKATKVYFEHEPVIAVVKDEKAKAFPLNILTYHEIVNDRIDDLYFSATYCPLCNAAIVFNRKLNFNGKNYLLDFGVSGMLRNSDLVMWDRQTESWWQQFMGEALVGELSGAELEMLPAQIISVGEFVRAYPKGQILSKETGFSEQQERYGRNVYKGYDSRETPYERIFSDSIDNRLPAMERVIDIQSTGEFKIYPHSTVAQHEVVNDDFNGLQLVLFHQAGTKSVMDTEDITKAKDIGSITVFDRVLNGEVYTFKKEGSYFKDLETNSTWSITGNCIRGKLVGEKLQPVRYGNHFAFSWFLFHPDSEIYE